MSRFSASSETRTASPATASESVARRFMPRAFESFTDREFRWFYVAMLGQMASMNMQLVVRGFLVFELTGSYAFLGLLGLSGALGMLAIAMFGGVIADRLPKRSVLQTGMLLSLANVLVLALLLILNAMRVEWLLISALAQGGIMGLMMPSRQAIIPDIVGTDRIMNAVALNVAGMNSMRLLAPATGGFIVAAAGFEWAFLVMAVFYALAVIGLQRVTWQPAVAPGQDGASALETGLSGLRDIREGLRYIASTRLILILLLVSFAGSIFGMPYVFLLPGYVSDIFDGGGSELGLLISISAVGSLAGTLLLASLPDRSRGLLLLLGMLTLGLGLFVFAQTTDYRLAAAIIIAVGLGSSFRQALSQGLIQSYVEDAYRGRVMSVFMTQFSMMQTGTFLVGFAAELIGVRLAFAGLGLGLALITVAVFLFVPRIRHLD